MQVIFLITQLVQMHYKSRPHGAKNSVI